MMMATSIITSFANVDRRGLGYRRRQDYYWGSNGLASSSSFRLEGSSTICLVGTFGRIVTVASSQRRLVCTNHTTLAPSVVSRGWKGHRSLGISPSHFFFFARLFGSGSWALGTATIGGLTEYLRGSAPPQSGYNNILCRCTTLIASFRRY